MKVKKLAYLSIGIALYVVVGLLLQILIVGHLHLDLGYVVFGVYCTLFGPIAFLVGVLGSMIESLIADGWLPIGWMAGQLFIGIVCGYTLKREHINQILAAFIIIAAVFIGIGLIKTIVECLMYQLAFVPKFIKNTMVSLIDGICMIAGYYISRKYNLKENSNG